MNTIIPTRFCYLLFVLSLPFLLFSETIHAQSAGELQAGAARINITPPADAAFQLAGYGGRTEGFTGILDSLYYRTIVVDDGRDRAAIIVGDLLFTTDLMWERLSKRIEKETGIPRRHIVLAATHTHGAPALFRNEDIEGKLKEYTNEVADKIVQSVKYALASLQPAKIGAGKGTANVNINRVARMGAGGYWLGQNPDGPSDKTVHVVRFEDLDGNPIAILVNYAVHGVVGGPGNLRVTADLPGATSRMVEKHYGDNVVVPWTSGAAGDQNPIYAVLENPNSGRVQHMTVLGQILGEEVIAVSENIARMTSRASIRGEQKVVSIPGKEPNAYNPDGEYEFIDADPLDVRLSLLMVGHLAFGCVSGEVLTGIGKRFKNESPFKHSIMITHCNGASGYLPDDQAYERPGYEIMVSRAKEGAENSIVNGLIQMINGL